MSERVLVTGAAGFLGRALVEELCRRRPRARLFLACRTPRPGHEACDLLDASAARALVRAARPAAVYHLAGSHRPLGFKPLWDVHVGATVNLLEALRPLKGPARPKVLVVGSAGEYGEPADARPLAETAECRPLTPYGATKLCQTLTAASYARLGLDVRVARVFNVVGPGMPEDLALGAFSAQIARAERGLQPPELRVGNLKPRRDYVDVRDAARALADVMRRGKPGEIYNVCSERSQSMEELLDRLLAFSRVSMRVASDARRRRAVDAHDAAGSGLKLRAVAGWKPRIRIEDSLKDTLDWHRERKDAPCPAS